MKYIIYFLFIIILVYFFIYNNLIKETFVSKTKMDKRLIVVLMNDKINDEYTSIIKYICNNYIDKCTYYFNKNKVDSSKKVNITNDKSLKTSTKIKNVNYLVIYEDIDSKNNDIYKKKFLQKWCNNKTKNKDNFIVINYNNITSETPKLLNKIEKKFKINIPMKNMLNYSSFNNDDIKYMASIISNNLASSISNL